MAHLSKEAAFFHTIAPKIINLVEKAKRHITIIKHKKDEGLASLNYATQVDIAIENLIVKVIRKRFPKDAILSEESFQYQKVASQGRVWIIDPICGTINASRGIAMFCTNIALVEKGKLVAGCVVDLAQKEYIWSVGEKKVYINDTIVKPKQTSGITIEVNIGALYYLQNEEKKKYVAFLMRLATKTPYHYVSFATSLGVAYVATGKIDAYTSPFCHVWDIAAAHFLIEQAGGAYTQLDGRLWTFRSTNMVGARDKKLHQDLLSLYKQT